MELITASTASDDLTLESPVFVATSLIKSVLFMAFIVVAVTWLGFINFTEARKTEVAKSNGEAWVEWLTEQGTKRFEADYKIEACKGGVKPSDDAVKTDTPVLGTWGACLDYIMKHRSQEPKQRLFQ